MTGRYARALPAIDAMRGGLIVSCQARPGSPLRHPWIMAAMAEAAAGAGAAGIRAAGADDIQAIRAVVGVPIVGLTKGSHDDSDVIITATREEAAQVVAAGADIVAIDATSRRRPGDLTVPTLIAFIHDALDRPVMADIDSLEMAVAAEAAGADVVATTLSGYTDTRPPIVPDLDLVARCVRLLSIPVVAEGRYVRPDQTADALRRGAYAIVVGTAITDVAWLTGQFVPDPTSPAAG